MDLSREARWLLEEKYGGAANAEFEADRARLARGEPLAYVIGWEPFLSLKIFLDSRPLIPRPETEWWVEKLVAERGVGPLRVLDLCAGSGAIGCAFLKFLPEARVYFGELEARHEATIRKNVAANNLDAPRAEVRIGDLFAPFKGEQFDLIVANPPYVPAGRALPDSVARYEPPEALYAGEDGLGIIERIAEGLAAHLAPRCEAWIECDSEHAEDARRIFRAEGFAARIVSDQFGAPRVIVVSSS